MQHQTHPIWEQRKEHQCMQDIIKVDIVLAGFERVCGLAKCLISKFVPIV